MTLQEKIKQLKLQIQILLIQLQIVLLRKKLTIPNLPKPKYIIIHHTVENNGFKRVNEWHRQLWGFRSSLGFYCGYQLYLEKLGKWYRARSDIEEGAHCPGHNKDSIGIAVQGDYRTKELTPQMNLMLTNKVDELRKKYGIPKENVLGDKEGRIPTRPTECPAGLINWVKKYRGI